MGRHVVRLSIRSIRKLGLDLHEAYLILPERTDEKAEVRAYSETGPLVLVISYLEALDALVT